MARGVARQLVGLEIPEYLDGEIWRGRIGGTAPGFGYYGLRSHVLLAACGEQESALEQDGRGLFTKELLSILESCAVKKLDLSYTEVLDRIHLIKYESFSMSMAMQYLSHAILLGSALSAKDSTVTAFYMIRDCPPAGKFGTRLGVRMANM